jgi:hypothetical protein
MGILWLFNTTGWFVGPAIMLAGLVALILCLRASSWARSSGARRAAVISSLVPFAVGVCGVLFGLGVWWWSGQVAVNPWDPWLALGKCCLAGLVVTVVPLVWAVVLLRMQRDVPPNAMSES